MLRATSRLFLVALALSESGCAIIAGLKDTEPSDAGIGDDPVTIAQGQAKPSAIAVADGKYVFWANEADQTLLRVTLALDKPGPPEIIARTAPTIIRAIAVDVDHAYWTASPPVAPCPNGQSMVGRTRKDAGKEMDGGTLDIRWSTEGCNQMAGLFVDGTNLYWTSPTIGNLQKMAKASTNTATIKNNQVSVTNIWADQMNVYWNNPSYDAIQHMDIFGFQADSKLVDTKDPLDLVGDATNIYWITQGGALLKHAKETPDAGANPDGGVPTTTLADGQGLISSLAVDERHIYFTVPNAGEIRRVSIGGGEVEVVVAKQNDPQRVALDTTRLYWTTYAGGGVFYMKKP